MNYGKSNIVKKHKELVSTPRRLTTKIMVYMFKISIFAVLLLAGAAGFLGLGLIKGIIDGAPSIDTINIAPAAEATTIYDSEGNLIEKLTTDGSNRTPVSLDTIPVHLRYAFIDIEDERFESHNGIDIKGIFRAAYQTLQGDMQGASTITQQLLKNNAFEDGGREDSTGALIKRKIQEIYLALQLEENVSKDIILENYLNTINLGSGCYGVQAASQRYFNKNVSDLTISESAVIAAITQNPYGYNPIYHPEANSKRRAHVLEYMLKNNHITKAEYEEAMADNVYDRIQETSTITADTTPYSFFTDELINQVINDLQEQKAYTYTQAINALYSGGLKIYSTQDTAIQKICDEETNNPDNYPGKIAYSFEWAYSVKLAEPDENGNTQKNYSQWSIINYHRNVLGNKDFKLIFYSQEEIDKCIEEYKVEIFKENVEEIGENLIVSIQPQVSFTVMDQKTGYVKALVGGRGEKTTNRALNRATDSTRQPGSCFKVLSTFAPAIDKYGYNIGTTIDDAPFYYDNGRLINNWWDKANTTADQRDYRGMQSIRTAIASSMNIITVKVLTDITPSAGYEYLKEFGFTTLIESRKNADGTFDSDINQSLALGGITDGVTNMELCAAYATIANGGEYTEPLYYTKVLDNSGKIILEREPERRQVLKESTAYILTDAMHGVVTGSGTGTKANVKGMYVAGKTGTTSNGYDIWFAGYTPYLTAAIWSGYDENIKLSNTSYHLTIWKNIMTRIHETKGYEYAEFTRPDSVVSAQVCAKCGNLATISLCDKDPEKNMIVTELFIAGMVPTERCVCHEEIGICNETGLLATDKCPSVTKRVFRIRYQCTDGKTWDTPYTLPDSLKGSYCNKHH